MSSKWKQSETVPWLDEKGGEQRGEQHGGAARSKEPLPRCVCSFASVCLGPKSARDQTCALGDNIVVSRE